MALPPVEAWAEMLESRGKYGEASAKYEAALRMAPRSVRLYIDWAHMLERAGLAGQATKLVHTAIQLQPRNAVGYLTLGNMLGNQQRHEQAAQQFRRAIEYYPRNYAEHFSPAARRETLVETGTFDRRDGELKMLCIRPAARV